MGTEVDNEPVQERATLCNKRKNEIAVSWFSRCIVPAGQVFQSLLGCMTSRTGSLSTLVGTNPPVFPYIPPGLTSSLLLSQQN